jgi:multidrug efflux pump subunit AcrB
VGLLRRAVARGTRIRLRSILLTSGTTMIGLLPLVIQFKFVEAFPFVRFFRESDGADIWENLALTSIGGLASSMVLILLAMPVLYYLSVRAGWSIRTAWGKLVGLLSAAEGGRIGSRGRQPESVS